MANFACTGTPDGAFPTGEYVLVVGDTNSGKTWLCMAALAEATLDDRFKNYRLILDSPEGGSMMDVAHYFGRKLEDRLERPKPSRTAEDFYFNLDDDIQKGKPFIRVLDSVDSLDTEADEEKFQARKAAFRKGRDAEGSFGTSKAKINSEYMRRLPGLLKKTGSILIIINQSHDKIGFGVRPGQKSRAGGHALEYYACMQVWLKIGETLWAPVSSRKLQVGILAEMKVKRSRITGKERMVEIPIFWSTGMDDVGSMVHWMVEWGHWKSKDGKIAAADLDLNLPQGELIHKIEQEGREGDLKLAVAEAWEWTEDKVAVQRKKRYE